MRIKNGRPVIDGREFEPVQESQAEKQPDFYGRWQQLKYGSPNQQNGD